MSIFLELDAENCRQRGFGFCVCDHSTTTESQLVGCTSFYSFISLFPLHFSQAKNKHLPQISSCTVTCYALVGDLGTEFLKPNSSKVRTTGEKRADSVVNVLLANVHPVLCWLAFWNTDGSRGAVAMAAVVTEEATDAASSIQTVPAEPWRTTEQTPWPVLAFRLHTTACSNQEF